MTMPQRTRKRIAGCGILLPARSIASSSLSMKPFSASVSAAGVTKNGDRNRPSAGWLGREDVEPEPVREEPRHELTLDAVARRIEEWGEGTEPSLAGRDGHDAAADPALARQVD